MTTPYNPVNFSSELVSRDKLKQLSNNVDWLFNNTPRLRYSVSGLTRDTGLKIIAGKVTYGTSRTDYIDAYVYFGTFFSANCKPVVVATCGDTSFGHRKYVMTRGLSGEIDHTGFIGHVVSHEHPSVADIRGGGWMHWIALGY